MTIDGFHDDAQRPFVAFDPAIARGLYQSVVWASRKLKIQVDGLDQVPRGRALLVANHAFGWDVLVPMAVLSEKLGRRVWVLGDHAWWKIPFVRRIAAAVGTVDGNPENVNRLLAANELVLVLPRGLREAVKPRELRYRLLWGKRYGFIRAAIRNQAPIVPLASIGADDAFDFVGNAYRRGERVLRKRGIPLPLPARILPIPHLVPLRFSFGEPIPPPAPLTMEHEDSVVRHLRREVEGALHELLEVELARRAGIAL